MKVKKAYLFIYTVLSSNLTNILIQPLYLYIYNSNCKVILFTVFNCVLFVIFIHLSKHTTFFYYILFSLYLF